MKTWSLFRTTAVVALAVALLLSGCGGRTDESTIILYGRENNSGTYMYFKEHVLNKADFASNVQTLPGTAAVINAVSKDPRSIGYGGIGYVKGVKVIPVKKDDNSPAVDASLQNVVNGSYPMSRNLYFYTVQEPQGAVRHFIAWVLGDEGQEVCQKVGYYPLPPERRPQLKSSEAPPEKKTITVKGSDTMVILGQRWAEHYMQKFPGVVVQVTGGGSGTGIAALINGATSICESSRPLDEKERGQIKAKFGKDPVEIPVAMDGLAVFVHESNPLKSITLAELNAIYTGKVRSWREFGSTSK
ncbi:MAG: substrate-binding domain-containing protein [Acidobacteriia bacterium]|nr:substrate-binding domain-containing protein [Terriglobia bacterium]